MEIISQKQGSFKKIFFSGLIASFVAACVEALLAIKFGIGGDTPGLTVFAVISLALYVILFFIFRKGISNIDKHDIAYFIGGLLITFVLYVVFVFVFTYVFILLSPTITYGL